jgi:cobalt-zinc-cadmium efflux system protein
VAGLVILLSGGMVWLDAAVSLVVAGVIALQALLLVREANAVLLESTPAGLDIDRLVAAMKAVAGVEEVHDVHAWSLSSEVTALSAHAVLGGHPTLHQAQTVGEQVKSAVAGFGIAHITLELECETCVTGDVAPCSIDSPEGMAAGAPGHGHHH